MSNATKINIKQAKTFLASHLGAVLSEVSLIGEGAWSQCFGFRRGDEEFVIRFGNYVSDFYKDRQAYMYASPELPMDITPSQHEPTASRLKVLTRPSGLRLSLQSCPFWKQCARQICPLLWDLVAGEGMGMHHIIVGLAGSWQ